MVGWYHSTDMSLSKLWELLMDREAWHIAVHGAIGLDFPGGTVIENPPANVDDLS